MRAVRRQHGEPVALPAALDGLEQEQPHGTDGDPVAVAQHGDRRVLDVSGVQVGLGEDCLFVDEYPVTDGSDGRRVRSQHSPAGTRSA